MLVANGKSRRFDATRQLPEGAPAKLRIEEDT
jgi:hypothetical protein